MALSRLVSIMISLATVAIVLVVAFLIVAQGQDQIENIENTPGGCLNHTGQDPGYGCNSTVAIQSAMSDVTDWLPIIVLTMIGSALIGMVVLFKATR